MFEFGMRAGFELDRQNFFRSEVLSLCPDQIKIIRFFICLVDYPKKSASGRFTQLFDHSIFIPDLIHFLSCTPFDLCRIIVDRTRLVKPV